MKTDTGKSSGSIETDRCATLKRLLDTDGFNVLKHLSRIEFKVGKRASAFTWHENTAEKAAQFCHFDFQK